MNKAEQEKESQWDISGTAPDEPTVLNYSNDLDKTGRFDLVIVSTSVVDFNKVAFTISLINHD